MDGSELRAGIEVCGRVLRYGEVRRGAEPELVRLGACDFDFDVAEVLFAHAASPHLDTVATAVREIFDDSAAGSLVVAVHPWDCTSFFSPLPAGMAPAERFEQLRQEAAMLSDASVARPVRVKAAPVWIETLEDGRKAHWHHVLRLSDPVHGRFDRVARQAREEAGQAPWSYDFTDATAAAATVMARRPELEEAEGFALALGIHGARTEYALCHDGGWHFGHHAETGALGDRAYFGAALLDRLGIAPDDVEHLYLYGDAVASREAAGVEMLLGLQAQPLNPLDVFHPARSGADPLALSAYVPVLGALLR